MTDTDQDRILAQKTLRDYCCAVCWGHLIERFQDGRTEIVCGKYGDEHQGFVTKTYIERRRSESIAEAIEVKRMLRQVGVLPADPKSAADILKELGF